MTDVNLVPNPRFHVGSDLWGLLFLNQPTRVTNVPFGALPAGADAAASHLATSGSYESVAQPFTGLTDIPWTVTWAGMGGDHASAAIYAEFFSATGRYQGEVELSVRQHLASGEWHVSHGTILAASIPAGSTKVGMQIWAASEDDTYLSGGVGYWTLACLGADPYGDGDTESWVWDAAAHASVSREIETYGANVLINGGASVVFERDVTLALNPGSVAATEMAIRNDEDGYGAWEAFAATKAWTLSAACKVWAKFRDSA